MYTLVFDTTSESCSVILLKDNNVITKCVREMEFGQAEALMTEIDIMLKNNDLPFKKIGLLGVCIGPGSFTGVRSSIAAARALSLAHPTMEITGITAFEGYVHSLSMFELTDYNAVIIETKRDDFYFQLFSGKKEKLSDPAALSYEEIISLLKGKNITLIGSGVERFLDKPSGLTMHAIRMDKSVSITDLAECALEKYYAHKLNFPKPLYLRAPDVCVKS